MELEFVDNFPKFTISEMQSMAGWALSVAGSWTQVAKGCMVSMPGCGPQEPRMGGGGGVVNVWLTHFLLTDSMGSCSGTVSTLKCVYK